MNRFGKATLLALAAYLAQAGVVACSSEEPGSPQNQEAVGSVGLNLEIAPGIIVNEVTYTITGNGITPITGAIPVGEGGSTVSAFVGGLPTGTGYLLTLTAVSVDGSVECAGSATFDIVAGFTTAVSVDLQCEDEEQIGGVIIDGTFNACPYITFYTVVPLQVAVGNTIALQAAADDINAADTLSFSWSATTGMVASATAANTTYTCSVAGSPTLTLTVSDGSCQDTADVQVDCVTLLCGNGVIDMAAGETCDDGNTAGGDACPSDCTLPVCGDRVIEPPETCDDGNTTNGDTCPSDCTLPVCNDGVIESPETCDPPNGTTCGPTCVAIPVICGNGIVQGAEECDDGNTIDDDECTNACTLPAECGNMEVEPGEQCEPPSTATCDADCQNITVCGQCESTQFPLVPDCAMSVSNCENAVGVSAVAAGGFPAGTPKSVLCEGVLECIRAPGSMNCGANGAEECFCGIGADLTNCISMNSPVGPCANIMQAAGESASAQTVSERFVDPSFALGLAISVFRCDQELCTAECFPFH